MGPRSGAPVILALSSLLCVAITGIFFAKSPAASDRIPSPLKAVNDVWVTLAAAATTGGFALWVAAVVAAAHAQRPLPGWLAQLPIIVIDDRAPRYGHAPFGTVIGGAALLSTLGLAGLYFSMRGRRPGMRTQTILGTAFVATAGLALFSPALTSFDLYAYAGASHAGITAGYHPIGVPFTGEWAAINTIYGTPIVPSPYGPVWLLVSYLLTAWAPTLWSALTLLRALELAALLACIGALRALRVPAHAIAVFALNPALHANFVTDGHNDLLAVAFVLAAAALRERSLPLAIFVAACAAGIKLPFLAIAPLAFALEPSVMRRFAAAGATVAVGLVLSFSLGAAGYTSALVQTASIYRATLADPTVDALRFALLALALGAVAAALCARRFGPTMSWAFVAFGTSLFGWYLAWGIPYAVTERRWLSTYLISLPLLSFLLTTAFAPTIAANIAFRLATLLAPIAVLFALRHERDVRLRYGRAAGS
jgi:hypothetical protein